MRKLIPTLLLGTMAWNAQASRMEDKTEFNRNALDTMTVALPDGEKIPAFTAVSIQPWDHTTDPDVKKSVSDGYVKTYISNVDSNLTIQYFAVDENYDGDIQAREITKKKLFYVDSFDNQSRLIFKKAENKTKDEVTLSYWQRSYYSNFGEIQASHTEIAPEAAQQATWSEMVSDIAADPAGFTIAVKDKLQANPPPVPQPDNQPK